MVIIPFKNSDWYRLVLITFNLMLLNFQAKKSLIGEFHVGQVV